VKSKIVLCIAYLFITVLNCSAQNMYFEKRSTFIGFHFGPAKYLGDLAASTSAINRESFAIKNSNFFVGAQVKRFYGSKLCLEFQFTNGKLSAADQETKYTSKSDPNYLRFKRNLDFRTNINEGSLSLTAFPLRFFPTKTWSNHKIQPFLGVGIAAFSFNPQGTFYDEIENVNYWVDLKPFKTEGQGLPESGIKDYKLTQINIPINFGVQWQTNDFMKIDFGISGRKLFTDYLDDVSGVYADKSWFYNYDSISAEQAIYLSDKSVAVFPFESNPTGSIRGNQRRFDAYYNYEIKVSFKIGTRRSKAVRIYKFDDSEICD
jgi:hypothetical protein